MICVLVLICVSGTKVGQLVVAPAKPAEERAPGKTVGVTSLDPWAQFCAWQMGVEKFPTILQPRPW
jgi:hypothetical protein